MRKLLLIFVFVLLLAVLTVTPQGMAAVAIERPSKVTEQTAPPSREVPKTTEQPVSTPEPAPVPTPTPLPTPIPTPDPTPTPKKPDISDEDLNLLARLTYREAGNEPVYGQRLVIDTVLNRVDHWAFPDTIKGVIYQKNQFSPAGSGSINNAPVLDSIVQLIYEELEDRTNYDVAFFRAGHYGPYGTPLFQVGGHYFCSYD